jgi:hypothetical protein
MQSEEPLTPALSPSDGEREKIAGNARRSLNIAFYAGGNSHPLAPIGWGEGSGVRVKGLLCGLSAIAF